MNPDIRTPGYVTELAREFRQSMTEAEKLLWSRLRKRQLAGYRFRKQHAIYRYILDFYCHEKMLAVEIDGSVHNNKEEYDNYRDEILKSTGIETLRFSNDEVINDIDVVLKKIEGMLKGRKAITYPIK